MNKTFCAAFMLLMLTGTTFAEVAIEKIILTVTSENRTREEVIRNRLFLKEGDVFTGSREFQAALDNQKQELMNTRYFKSINIIPREIGQNTYEILISYEDSLTFVPIPYPIPDSAIGKNGWSFGLEVNYDNAFGSMTDLYFDGYANIAFGEQEKLKEWKVGPRWDNVMIAGLTLSFEYIQKYKTTEMTDPLLPETQQLRQHYANHESFLNLSTSFDLGSQWAYTIKPALGFKYLFDYHSSFEGDLAQENNKVIEDRLNIVLGHSISLNRVNWVESLRDGYSLEFSHNLRFLNSYLNESQSEAFRFVTDTALTGSRYFILGKRFNYYTRAKGLAIFNNYDTGLGSRLRGVKNSSMYGDLGFFWQNTLGIEMIHSGAFHFQLHPFADTGFALYTQDLKPIQDVIRVGVGSDLIFMIGSVDIRIKIGYDPVSDYVDFNFKTGLSY